MEEALAKLGADLEKYDAYIKQDGFGPTATLLGKVEEL